MPITFDEDSNNWWSGVQKCMANVALAATLAITTLSTTQASAVYKQDETTPAPEEYFWVNPVAPVPLTFGRLYLPDPEELPANKLRGQPDEDFWVNPVAPVPSYPVPKLFLDPEEIPAGNLIGPSAGNPIDDDSWRYTSTQPSQWLSVLFTSTALAGTPPFYTDEDFWVNPVAPVPLTFGKLYLPDPDEIPTAFRGQPDEDFWINQVPPVGGNPYQRLPYGSSFDVEELPANTLRGQPDEDFWVNQVLPIGSYPVPRFFIDDDILPGPFNTDEDFWVNPVAPVLLSFGRLYLPDPEELPATLRGEPDEDFWINSIQIPSQWTSMLFTSSGSPLSAPLPFDEEFWINQVQPIAAYPVPKIFLDDDVIPSIVTLKADEDFWVNPVAPVPLTFGRLYLPDPEEISATSLRGQPDEDFWAPPSPWPIIYAKPFADDDVLFPPPPPFHADEDFWQTAITQPLPWLSLLFSSTASIPPPPFNTDEDFWVNPVAPVAFYPVPQQAFIYDDIIAHSQLSIKNDEDFWVNPVAPVAASLWQRLPYLSDPEEIPAGSLVGPIGHVDDEHWLHRVQQQNLAISILFGSIGSAPQQASLFTDDAFPTAAPVPLTFLPLYLPDPEELPAGSFVGPGAANPIDEYWQNPVAPIAASLWQRLPYLPDPEELPAGNLFIPPIAAMEDFWPFIVDDTVQDLLLFLDDGSSVPGFQPDEDFWTNQIVYVPPVAFYPIPPQAFSYDDVITQPPTTIDVDEIYWQNPAAPVPLTFLPLYLPDPEELPAGSFVGPGAANPIDEYWQNPVAPIAASLWQRLPYLPDPEEIPARSLFGQPDEDFWVNPVAPVVASLWQRLPYGSLTDPEEISVGNFFGQPDEDFWMNPIQPVAGSPWQRLPYLPDPEEIPNLAIVEDEDFWTNPVAPIFSFVPPRVFLDDDVSFFSTEEDFWQNPVPPSFGYPTPLAFVDDEIIPTPPPIPDEDFWINLVAPVVAYVPPLVFSDDEIWVAPPPIQDEDFWFNPVPPVVGNNYIPLPYLPDPEKLPAGSLIGFIPLTIIGSGKITALTGSGQVIQIVGTGEID